MLFVEKFSAAIARVRVRPRAALLFILLSAFFLRVFRLDAPALWWDESLSLYRATRDLATILANTIQIQNVVTTDLQPPLYFVALHFLTRATGVSEFALRFLTVAASLASVALLFALGARLFSARVGVLAALIGALSPFYIAYAQEARPYAFVLFWSLLAMYALARAFDSGRGSTRINADENKNDPNFPSASASKFGFWILIFVFSSAAALYSHYYAIFLFPFFSILIALLIWNTPRSKKWILLPALPFASIIFLIPIILRGAAGNVLSGPSAVALPTILFDLLNSFSVGISADAGEMLWMDAAMLAFFSIGIAVPLYPSWRAKREFRNSLLLLAYLCIPLAALQLATLYRPLYQNSRYFIALSPAFYLGVAAGIGALAARWRYAALPALAIIFFGAAMSLNNLYFVPRYGKDDHRAWAEFLRARARPGDFLILNSPHAEELYNYYARGVVPYTTLPILRVDGAPSPDADNLAILRAALQKNARVWYLTMHAPFDDPENRIEKLFDATGVLMDRNEFPGASTGIALAQYAAAMPIARDAREISTPANFRFGSSLRLVGFDAPREIEAGARGIVKLFFQLDESLGEDYGVSLRVIDDEGGAWGQWDARALGNRAGTSTWTPRAIYIHTHDLPISIGARPGNYQLRLAIYRASTGASLGTEKLTNLAITRPRAPIDPATLRATTRLDQTIGAVRVIGAEMPTGAVKPGDALSIALYFQVLQKPRADISIALQIAERAFPFIGSLTTRVETRAALARDAEAGDIVRVDFAARVPADARGEMIARAVIANQMLELGALRVQEIARATGMPKMSRQLSARLGDSVELLGYDLARAGDSLRLTLYWRAVKEMPISYTVFAHVLDEREQIIAQHDQIPGAGARQTSGWIAGEIITDEYNMMLNAAPRGNYRVAVGMYDAATGARLPADAGDRIFLEVIRID